MSDIYDWYETLGGPHLLVPEEFLSAWRGDEGWSAETDGRDASDYSRTRNVCGWIGIIACGQGEAAVLGGDVGPIAWLEAEDFEGGYLVQWLGIDNESDIAAALSSEELQRSLAANTIESGIIQTGKSGVLRLIDSVDAGDKLQLPNRKITLKPGQYSMSANDYETETMVMVVRKLELTRNTS